MKNQSRIGLLAAIAVVVMVITSCDLLGLSGPGGGSGNELPGSIDADTTLTDRVSDPNVADYVANAEVAVNATLTIEPGVVIAFAEDVTLIIESAGTIIAEGESGTPVRFTSTNAGAGIKWGGIRVESASQLNKLNHVVVEHAGGYNNHFISGWQNVAVSVYQTGKLAVTNSTISDSDDYGLWVAGELTAFGNNTFTGNANAPLRVNPNSWSRLDAATTFSGNGVDAALITGGYALTTAQTVTPLGGGVPYLVYDELVLEDDLTVEPGTLIHFDAKAEFAGSTLGMLIVDASGSLNADGTPTNPITFTSSDIAGGRHWTGIRFDDNASSTLNVMDNVIVSYGGGYNNHYVNGWKYANIGLEAGSRLTLTNSTISHAEAPAGETAYGIAVATTATLTDSGNTYSDNEANMFP